MPAVRVLFIGQGPSGLAEDRIVNSFYFWRESLAVDGGDLVGCTDAVAHFYNAVPAGGSKAVGEYLSPWVSRTVEYRAYNMADAKPREPVITLSVIPGGASSGGLPEEVAMCLTLHGTPPNTARRRGRVYIGPLSGNTSTGADGNDAARPTLQFMTDVGFAARELTLTTLTDMNWSIQSTLPTVNYVPIVSGYCDNAFDTQRRRGPDPTQRIVWDNIP